MTIHRPLYTRCTEVYGRFFGVASKLREKPKMAEKGIGAMPKDLNILNYLSILLSFNAGTLLYSIYTLGVTVCNV